MRARVLQESTYAKDINGAPLSVGDVAEVDPALGNAWACLGLVEIVEHDRAALSPSSVLVPDDDGEGDHIYTTDADGNRVRDYRAERLARKRADKVKPKTKRKETKDDAGDDEGGAT